VQNLPSNGLSRQIEQEQFATESKANVFCVFIKEYLAPR